ERSRSDGRAGRHDPVALQRLRRAVWSPGWERPSERLSGQFWLAPLHVPASDSPASPAIAAGPTCRPSPDPRPPTARPGRGRHRRPAGIIRSVEAPGGPTMSDDEPEVTDLEVVAEEIGEFPGRSKAEIGAGLVSAA